MFTVVGGLIKWPLGAILNFRLRTGISKLLFALLVRVTPAHSLCFSVRFYMLLHFLGSKVAYYPARDEKWIDFKREAENLFTCFCSVNTFFGVRLRISLAEARKTENVTTSELLCWRVRKIKTRSYIQSQSRQQFGSMKSRVIPSYDYTISSPSPRTIFSTLIKPIICEPYEIPTTYH